MKTLRHLLFSIGSSLTALSIVTVIISWVIVTGIIGVPTSVFVVCQWCYTWWWVPEAIGVACLILWGLLFRAASPGEPRTRKRRQGAHSR